MSADKPLIPEVSIDGARNAAISRRGGVKVRGGRLPPIRMRNLPQINNAKKTVVPNIPQRRIKVKEEPIDKCESERPKQVEKKDLRGNRGRGRGRGNALIVQTEGTFWGQGPAARVKIESSEAVYERVSISRSSKSGGKMGTAKFDQKPDDREIKLLLESLDENEDFIDYQGTHPVKLPFPKMELKNKIKKERLDVCINKEIKDEDIKDESVTNKWNALEGKFFTPIEPEVPKKENFFDLIDSTKLRGDSVLLLFQFPRCMPFANTEHNLSDQSSTTSKSAAPKEKDNEKEEKQDLKPSSFFGDMSDGYIGKLQVLKSGKMRLVLGSLLFKVETGSDSESLMESASVRIQGESSGDIVVLGKIERKMIVRPSCADLLDNDLKEELLEK